MKYIKLFENFIKENQMKLFPDYEKEHSDNPKDVGDKYLKDRTSKQHKKNLSGETINNWNVATRYELSKNDYLELSREDFFGYDGYIKEILDINYDDLEDGIKSFHR